MPGHKMKSFGRSFRESPNVGKEFAQKKTSLEKQGTRKFKHGVYMLYRYSTDLIQIYIRIYLS